MRFEMELIDMPLGKHKRPKCIDDGSGRLKLAIISQRNIIGEK